MPTGSLPAEAKKIWEKVYDQSISGGDSKEKAAKKAWGAIKNAGWKKGEEGQWTKGKSEFAEFSMVIIKAPFDRSDPNPNHRMRWRSVNSDTDEDLYEESMSLELFNDFTRRINDDVLVPDAFKDIVCEEDWCGGLPYLSIAHYKSGTDSKNVPGVVESVYVDGNKLKSKGFLSDSPLGHATFDSLKEDLYKKRSGDKNVTPVRISIGFLDLKHKHVAENGGQEFIFTRTDVGQSCSLCSSGIGSKIYLEGQLVHLAMTRVPVNPRTEMEVEKSMIRTKKDDAKSIVGDLVEEMEEKSQVGDILVIKSEDLEARVNSVRYAFYDKYSPPPAPSLWLVTVMDDSVIVE